MMTLSKARWKARSVPGRIGSHSAGLGGRLGEARIEVNHFRTPVNGLAQGGGLGGGDGFHQVAAGQDDVLELS